MTRLMTNRLTTIRLARARRAAVALLAVSTLLAGCRRPGAAREGAFKVGLVFDVGGRGDGGFNDGAAVGAELARKEGGVTVAYADAGADGQSASMRRFAEQGVDLVVAVGFLASRDATLLAREFPRVKFAVIDYSLPSDADGRAMLPPPNLEGVGFREQEGSYLVGAAAGLASRTGTVGFVGGMASPLIGKFEAGYTAGVHRACPRCTVIARYAGRTPDAFRDPAMGRTLALAEYGAGADVVFHAAGGTGAGVFAAARETGKRAIGVDVDQWKEAPGAVLTSMVKRIDVAVHDVIRQAESNEFAGGMRSLGLAESGVGYVLDAHNRPLLPADAPPRLETLRAAIAAGMIEAPASAR